MENIEDSKWMEKAREFKNLVDENGRFPKLQSTDEAERSLDNWCIDQKKKYKEEKLSNELNDSLEQSQGWTWETEEDNK